MTSLGVSFSKFRSFQGPHFLQATRFVGQTKPKDEKLHELANEIHEGRLTESQSKEAFELLDLNEREKVATILLKLKGCRADGRERLHGPAAKSAYIQSKFEGRMTKSGFRGASRK